MKFAFMASLNVSSITKVQTSNYVSRIKYETNPKACGFNGLIKSFSDDPQSRQAGPWIDRWLNSSFEKPLRGETRLTKIDEMLAMSCKSKIISRKRIEKRSVRFKISNTNSRKLQTFRFPRKV